MTMTYLTYRYKNADQPRTQTWHGYYLLGQAQQDRRLRDPQRTLDPKGTLSAGDVLAREGFDQRYEEVDS